MSDVERADFFISHTAADAQWAQWIRQTLESNGYRALLMETDFRPGHNFVVRMQQAAVVGVRVLAVISPAYMESAFGTPEWAAAFSDDPTGEARQLIPVLVANTPRRGLLNQIVPIDLRGKSEEDAVEELLSGVGSSERRLPAAEVTYPGEQSPVTERHTTTEPAEADSTTNDEWVPLEQPVALPERSSDQRGAWNSNVVIEVVMIPIPGARLQMSALRDLPDELAGAARAARFFTGAQALSTRVRDGVAVAESQIERDTSARGLSVARDGTTCLWQALPQDGMGAVVDLRDVETRIANLLGVAGQLPTRPNAWVAVGVRMIANGMYIFGDAGVIGSRSGASGLQIGDGVFEVGPEDSVTSGFLFNESHAVARELVARLEATWPTR